MNDDIENVGPEDLNQVMLALAGRMGGMSREQAGLIAQLSVIAQQAVNKLAHIDAKAAAAEVGELVRIASGRALAMRKFGGIMRGPDDAALIEDLCDQVLAFARASKLKPKPAIPADVMTVEQAMTLTGSRTFGQLANRVGYRSQAIVSNWRAAGRVPDKIAEKIRRFPHPDRVVAGMVGEVAA